MEVGGFGPEFPVGIEFAEGALELVFLPVSFGKFGACFRPCARPAVLFAVGIEGLRKFFARGGVGEGGAFAEAEVPVFFDPEVPLFVPFAGEAFLLAGGVEDFRFFFVRTGSFRCWGRRVFRFSRWRSSGVGRRATSRRRVR